MNFIINFNPYPGSSYFTVHEYLRSFDPKVHKNPDEYLLQAEKHLRNLFRIPSGFTFEMCEISMKEKLMSQMGDMIVKDDPVSGIDSSTENKETKNRPLLLDLSYSFPDILHDKTDYNVILIDPNASLGIPVEFLLLFHTEQSQGFSYNQIDQKNFDFIKDTFLLSKVLSDYAEKGVDILLRESNYKAVVLYQMIENNKYLKSVPSKKKHSKTMICAECDHLFLDKIKKMGYEFGTQRVGKKPHITIANYPTHSKELIEMFSDRILSI